MEGVPDQVMGALCQLLLDGVVQLIAGFGLHQAGVGRANQSAELDSGQAELAFAVGVEK
ncbi:hypothetical protein D3C72_2569780 [compost metagenome]